MHLGLEKHPLNKITSLCRKSLKLKKMNGKILTLSFRLLKFTGFLERFLILPGLREGLPCVTSLGDVPSAAQWHSKSFPPAVAAAGLGNQHPG